MRTVTCDGCGRADDTSNNPWPATALSLIAQCWDADGADLCKVCEKQFASALNEYRQAERERRAAFVAQTLANLRGQSAGAFFNVPLITIDEREPAAPPREFLHEGER